MLTPFIKQSTTLISRVYHRAINSQCVLCAELSPHTLCPDCQLALPTLSTACPKCAEPNEHGHLCGHCLREPPAFKQVLCPYIYGQPLDGLIQRWKNSHWYHRQQALGLLPIFQQLIETVRPHDLDAVVAVPYHWRRLWQRGHSPTQLLARQLSRALDIPEIHPLQRVKFQSSQQSHKRQQRIQNLRGAFQVNAKQPTSIQGKDLLLVDDVLTTGATAHHASLALLKAGARSVTLACLARVPAPT